MHRKRSGTTLAELLAVLAITALLATLAMPGAHRWLVDARAERTLHGIGAALAYARLVAVTTGEPVVLCNIDHSGRCTGDWSAGIALFRDRERRARLLHHDDLLRVFPASRERVELRAFRTTRYFRYLPSGQTDWQNGRFVVCPTMDGIAVRSLVVNVQGRTRTQRPVAADPACAS